VFDAIAASTTRPAGLREGVAATTATSGGGIEAFKGDLGKLGGAVAAVGGKQVVFVTDAASYFRIPPEYQARYTFLVSNALAAGTLIAIATPAFYASIDPTPRITIAQDALVHMSSVPQAIVDSSTANPVRSMFQSDSTAVGFILGVGWGLRARGAIAWTSGITW
jgi:hypothetical protein